MLIGLFSANSEEFIIVFLFASQIARAHRPPRTYRRVIKIQYSQYPLHPNKMISCKLSSRRVSQKNLHHQDWNIFSRTHSFILARFRACHLCSPDGGNSVMHKIFFNRFQRSIRPQKPWKRKWFKLLKFLVFSSSSLKLQSCNKRNLNVVIDANYHREKVWSKLQSIFFFRFPSFLNQES